MFRLSKRSSILVFLTILLLVFSTVQVTGNEDKNKEISLSQVEKAYNLIRENYVKPDSISKEELIRGAIEGMLKKLPDPHDKLFTKEGYQKFYRKVVRGNYVGVGVILDDKGKYISVMETFPYNPASQSGIKPRDLILEINGKSTAEMTYREARDTLRGKQGEEVKLKVKHPDGEKEEITLRKIPVQIPAVEHELLLDGKIGLIDVNYYREDVEWRVDAAINLLENDDLQGFILDLRNNGGGLLGPAIAIASRFVDSGLIMKYKKQKGEKKYTSEGNATPNLPLVVLINDRTASASETIAAAIRYHDMGVLAGRRSYGKQYGQNFFQLGGELYLRLSTLENFVPKVPQAGLKPDLKSPDYWKDIEIAIEWIKKHAGEKTPLKSSSKAREDVHREGSKVGSFGSAKSSHFG